MIFMQPSTPLSHSYNTGIARNTTPDSHSHSLKSTSASPPSFQQSLSTTSTTNTNTVSESHSSSNASQQEQQEQRQQLHSIPSTLPSSNYATTTELPFPTNKPTVPHSDNYMQSQPTANKYSLFENPLQQPPQFSRLQNSTHSPSLISRGNLHPLNHTYGNLPGISKFQEDDLFGISPEIENYFTHDFKCCGLHLKDMHESLLHYEMYHVKDERNTSSSNLSSTGIPSSASDHTYSIQKHSDLFLRPENSAQFIANQALLSTEQILDTNDGPLSHHSSPKVGFELRKRKHLLLELKPNNDPSVEPHKMAAFDDTIIRTRNAYRPQSITADSGSSEASVYGNLSNLHRSVPSTSIKHLPTNQLASISNIMPPTTRTNSHFQESNLYTTSINQTSKNLFNGHSLQQSVYKPSPSLQTTASSNSNNNLPYASRLRNEKEQAFIVTSPNGTKTIELQFFHEDAEDDSSYASPSATNAAYSTSNNSSSATYEHCKPYPCTFPGCNKTYKNPNGLKYHMMHGHESPSNDADKPYECNVAGCGKRYKNPNGLKYHAIHAHKLNGGMQVSLINSNIS